MNAYYNSNGVPRSTVPASARNIVAELRAITRGMDMLPPLAGLGNRIVSMAQGGAQMDHQTYAVGTWTPTFVVTTPGNLNIVYGTRVGHYVRIGPLVYLAFKLVTTTFTHTTASGNVWISGAPSYYATAGSLASFNSAYVNYTSAGMTQASFNVIGYGNQISVYTSSAASSTSAIFMTHLPSGTNLTWGGSILYQTSTIP